ncbi:MAG: biotin synthase auxiliary protein BsaP [Pseudonocardiales bacterium]
MTFCDACGRPLGEGQAAQQQHLACIRRRALEPPRYCPQCARRMVVQVTPSGWSARCSAHGALGAADPELV